MAAFTSKATGNWSASGQTTWNEVGVPANGDTVTIQNTHSVTVDVDTTVGSSPADITTFVLTVTGATAKLIIAAGKTLTVNGNSYFNAGAANAIAHGLELNAGSTLLFGSNTVNWIYKLGRYNVVYARGALGNNAAIRGQNSASAMAVCTIDTTATFAGGWDCQYTTFQYLGKSNGSVGLGSALNGFINTGSQAANILSFDNCLFDNVWQIYFNIGSTTGCTVSFTNNTFTNPLFVSSNSSFFLGGKAGNTSATNTFTGNTFDNIFRAVFAPPGLMTCSGNYFGGGISAAPTTAWPDGRFASFTGNLMRYGTTTVGSLSNPAFQSSMSGNYVLEDNDNNNFGGLNGAAFGGNSVWSDSVLDYTCITTSGGDGLRPFSDGTTKVPTAMANNGSGLIRVTTAAHGFNTGDKVYISQTLGTVEANNHDRTNPTWTITVVDATNFDLQGSTFTNAFTANASFNYVCRVVVHLAVSSAASSGGLVQVTTPTHNFSTGDVVTIAGCVPTSLNGTWTITVTSTTTFTLNGSTFSSFTSGGTVDRPVTSNTLRGWIMLPTAYGATTGKLASFWGNSAHSSVAIEHNTYISSDPNTTELGIGTGEQAAGYPGLITSFKSNLAWSPLTSGSPAGMPNDPNANPGTLLVRWSASKPPGGISSETQDYVYAENADYNWLYNGATENSLYGYWRVTGYRTSAFFSTGAPDAHGAQSNTTYRQDPQFVDTSRNMATYDSAKLGNSATAWSAASVAYNAGDMVSVATSTVYYGATVNYRCTVAHTSGSTTKPGVGASWRTNWEHASLYRLRQDLTRIADLLSWVRAGYRPQNPAIANTSYPGDAVLSNVGAVAYVSTGGPFPFFLNGLNGGLRDLVGGIRG